MALSGELSDLSLAELIEFFCNQRKSGRLKISYERAPGFFYFQNGALADAKIGVLRGVEAVYYALTLENAQFKFSPSFPPEQRTINQPWAQVALEGLRRMDEGVIPIDAFPTGEVTFGDDGEPIHTEIFTPEFDDEPAFPEAEIVSDPLPELNGHRVPEEREAPLSLMVESSRSSHRKLAMVGAVVVVLLVTAAIGVPAGWYGKRNAPAAAPTQSEKVNPSTGAAQVDQPAGATEPSSAAPVSSTIADTPKANHETRDRTKPDDRARTDKPAAADTPAAAPKPEPAKAGPRSVTVQVSYDENGRVTQASGGDATAARIARQRRFPAGKPGTATVTIPLN